MKKYLALMGILFCAVLAIWVAFRLAPETWAVIAGLVFGLIATLPMCGIIIMMIMRGNNNRGQSDRQTVYMPPQMPLQQPYATQQPYIVLNAEQGYGGYMQAPPQMAPQLPAAPQHAPYAQPQRSVAPRAYYDRTSGAPAPFKNAPSYRWAEQEEQWQQKPQPHNDWLPEQDEQDNWSQPAPRTMRVLGD